MIYFPNSLFDFSTSRLFDLSNPYTIMKFIQFLFIFVLLIFVLFIANDPLLFHFLTSLNPIHWILFSVMGIYFYKNQLDLHIYGFLIMFYIFCHSSLFYQIIQKYPQYFAWLPDNMKNPHEYTDKTKKNKKNKNKKVSFHGDATDGISEADTDTDSIYQDYQDYQETEQENDNEQDNQSQIDPNDNNPEDIQKIHQILYESYGTASADHNENTSPQPAQPVQPAQHVQGIDLPKYTGNSLDLMEQGDNKIIQQFKTSMVPSITMSINEIENFPTNPQ